MDEQEKPFDIVSIVILMMIGLANDAAEIVFDLLAATVVGLPGEAIMEPINLLVDGLITTWFFLKLGFGGPAAIQLVDDVLELFGVPGRTICIGLGIWIANHPKSAISKGVQLAATVETGGAGAASEAAEGAEAAGNLGAAAAEGEAAAAKAGTAMEGAPSAAEKTGETGEGGTEKSEREKEAEEALTPEAEKNPMEVEEKKLFNEGPDEDSRKDDSDEKIAA